MTARRWIWAALAALVLAEIGYPLVNGPVRAAFTVATVVVGFLAVVTHATNFAGVRTTATLLLATTAGGFAVEAIGVHTGFPFGRYTYSAALGPRVLGVPLVIPLAWTWMAWPSWLAAGRLLQSRSSAACSGAARSGLGRLGVESSGCDRLGAESSGAGRLGADRSGPVWVVARVLVAGWGLAAWDLFLDPQMTAERYWTWHRIRHTLPGVPDVPLSNYLGWLAVAVVLVGLLATAGGPGAYRRGPGDTPMVALYLWTYLSSVLAHAVFLGMPASAGWGALGMGLVAVPVLATVLVARR